MMRPWPEFPGFVQKLAMLQHLCSLKGICFSVCRDQTQSQRVTGSFPTFISADEGRSADTTCFLFFVILLLLF